MKMSRLVYSRHSGHHDISVVDGEGGRLLLTGGGRARKQSCVDLDNLREHKLNYSPLLFSALLFAPEPRRALVAGLGAGVVPREMVHYLDSVHVDVIELDLGVLDVAREFFAFKEGPRLKVIPGDAREVMAAMQTAGGEPYNIIILDAFQGDYIPGHLVTVEFLTTVRSLLSEAGVVAANVFNTHAWFGSQVRTFEEVFGGGIYALNGTSAPATTILFAAGSAAPEPGKGIQSSPAEIASRLGLCFELRVPLRQSSAGMDGDCRVLRDGGGRCQGIGDRD